MCVNLLLNSLAISYPSMGTQQRTRTYDCSMESQIREPEYLLSLFVGCSPSIWRFLLEWHEDRFPPSTVRVRQSIRVRKKRGVRTEAMKSPWFVGSIDSVELLIAKRQTKRRKRENTAIIILISSTDSASAFGAFPLPIVYRSSEWLGPTLWRLCDSVPCPDRVDAFVDWLSS